MQNKNKNKKLVMPKQGTYKVLTEQEQKQISDSAKPIPPKTKVKINHNIPEMGN